MRDRLHRWRYCLYRWRYRMICTGWRGRGPGRSPTRAPWIGRHMVPLPTWFGTMDLSPEAAFGEMVKLTEELGLYEDDRP